MHSNGIETITNIVACSQFPTNLAVGGTSEGKFFLVL